MKIRELVNILNEYDKEMDVFVSDEPDRIAYPCPKLGFSETYPSMTKRPVLFI